MVTVGDCGWDGEMVRARELMDTAGKVAVQAQCGLRNVPAPAVLARCNSGWQTGALGYTDCLVWSCVDI